MPMRIVSQDNKFSFNFNDIVLWCQQNLIYARIGNQSEVLGTYEDNERAQEVFDDIHKAFAPVDIVSTNMTAEQVELFNGSKYNIATCVEMNDPDVALTCFDNLVYRMPKE